MSEADDGRSVVGVSKTSERRVRDDGMNVGAAERRVWKGEVGENKRKERRMSVMGVM